MAHDLTTLDCIGTTDRLCRIPNTLNPKRKRYAVAIDARKFAADPHGYVIPNVPRLHDFHHDPFYEHESTFSLIKWVHDNPPEQKNIEYDTMVGDVVSSDTIPIMPCLDSIYTSNPTHHVRVALAQHLLENLKNFITQAL